MTSHEVLILSSDPLAAALLGAAVELTGHTPRFPLLGEPARVALRRIRPRVVLVDCDHEEGCDDSFIGPALMTGARTVLFHSHRTRRDIGDLASRMQVPILEMPADQGSLGRVIRAIAADDAELMP